MNTLQKIVVIGPESTGKSMLCQQLAAHYQTLWVPEYARTFLTRHGMDYTYDNLLTIAQEQIKQEDRIAATAPHNLLFVDTDMNVMKVWCEVVFGQCHPWIEEQIATRSYQLYLLMNTDIPWAPDPLREYPDLATRQKLYTSYKDIVRNTGIPWADISGDYATRLQKAIAAVDALRSA
jgi:NadR type nicotinamide-nucleotide adenylyltransferase